MRWTFVWLVLLCSPAAFAGSNDEPKTVTVKAGESVADIAGRELGDRGRWKDIYVLNGMPLDQVPKVGQLLKLPPPAAVADALLSLVYRAVTHRSPTADWLASATGTGLFRLWRVRTEAESRAEVSFRDSSKLRLDPKALVVIYSGTAGTAQQATAPAPERAKLVSGDLQAFLAKSKSPVAVATSAARLELQPGSVGRMEVDRAEKTSTLSVYQGSGNAQAQGQKVEVAAGFASRTLKGGAPGAAVPIPAAPTFSGESRVDGLAFGATGSVELSWSPVPNAAKFRLEVAEDLSFTRTVKDLSVDVASRRAKLDLPPGHYLARVSAIDQNRITGFPSKVQAVWIGKPSFDAPFGKVEVAAGANGDVTLRGPGLVRLHAPGAATAQLQAKVGTSAAAAWQRPLEIGGGKTAVTWSRNGRKGGTITVEVVPLDLVVEKGAVEGDRAEIRFHFAVGATVVAVPGTVSATLGGVTGTVTRIDGAHFLFRGESGKDDTLVVRPERAPAVTRPKALARRCWSLTSLGQGCR